MSRFIRKFLQEVQSVLDFLNIQHSDHRFSPVSVFLTSIFFTVLLSFWYSVFVVPFLLFYIVLLFPKPGSFFLDRLKSIVLLFFALLVISLPLYFGGGYPSVYVFVLRVLLANIPLIFAVSYLGFYDLVSAMRRLGVPKKLCFAVYLLLWNVSLIVEEFSKMLFARSIRVFSNDRKGFWFVNASVVGDGLLKSRERALRFSYAMTLRGEFVFDKSEIFKPLDLLLYGVVVCAALVLF